MKDKNAFETLPLVPLKEAVLFPRQLQSVVVGRKKSLAAVEAALAREEKELFVVAQRDGQVSDPAFDDLFGVGTKAVVKKATQLPNGPLQLVLQGVERAVLLKLESATGYLQGRVRPVALEEVALEEGGGGAKVDALRREVQDLARKVVTLLGAEVPVEVSRWILNQEDPVETAYFLASILSLELEKEQALLEASSVLDLLTVLHRYLTHEVRVLELRNEISSRAQTEMSKEQRDYMLRQQLRAIQEELGEAEGENSEVADLRSKFAEAELPEKVRQEGERDFRRLESLPLASPEYSVLRGYLEFLLELPWSKRSESQLDIKEARRVLDEDHCDLEEVKERILEHLGVLKLNPEAKAPILCFVGPPGVGKTSLGASIARALGREFERTSLGGMSDEAELRGHRRTYIGAMPGRILQALRRAEVNNPVVLLDEVDKLGRDFRGDPAAALLEILDPEQNHNFRDNYLDQPFDLSKVLFVATANTLETIPAPLLDRLEVIRFSGYSREEKTRIATKYLLPRQLEEAGLTADQCVVAEEAIHKMISAYTREAGVRQLNRRLGRIARKVALQIAEGKTQSVTLTPDNLEELLGRERFSAEKARKELVPGVAQGLAWTPTGGEVLYIEASLLAAGDGLKLTGHLGKVMKESAAIAQSYVWAHSEELKLAPSLFKNAGVHVHVPAGAIPKDGPSAGIAIAAALASIYTNRGVRKDTALTGELTLTGLVLPVGGVKEKLLAARQAGITRVILSGENEKDTLELPDAVRGEMEFVFVENVDEVLKEALERKEPPELRKVG